MNKWRGLLLTQSPKEMDHQPWAWFTHNQKPEQPHLLGCRTQAQQSASFLPTSPSQAGLCWEETGQEQLRKCSTRCCQTSWRCPDVSLCRSKTNTAELKTSKLQSALTAENEVVFFPFLFLWDCPSKALKAEHTELVPFVRANWEREKCSSPALD